MTFFINNYYYIIKLLKIVMTAMIAGGLTKIDLFYSFFFCNTYKITVSFL